MKEKKKETLKRNPDGSVDWLSEPFTDMYYRLKANGPTMEWYYVMVAQQEQRVAALSPEARAVFDQAKKEFTEWAKRYTFVAPMVIARAAAHKLMVDALG